MVCETIGLRMFDVGKPIDTPFETEIKGAVIRDVTPGTTTDEITMLDGKIKPEVTPPERIEAEMLAVGCARPRLTPLGPETTGTVACVTVDPI